MVWLAADIAIFGGSEHYSIEEVKKMNVIVKISHGYYTDKIIKCGKDVMVNLQSCLVN